MRHATNHPSAEPLAESGTDRDPVEALAEEFLQRRRQGADITVTEYVEKYPHWSQQIRELFSTLLVVEEMKTVRRQSTGMTSAGEPPSLSDEPITRLGDFRVVREIGRGGMGVVYEAEQESLGRRVALKVVSSPSLASPKALRRFRREARAAARLHHTNIVPVFGVGEEDGRHYYVMQYIEGCSLDCMLNELTGGSRRTTVGDRPSLRDERPVEAEGAPIDLSAAPGSGNAYWHDVAHIAVQAADALQYAHGAGVLHRDIKPGNLLLDKQGIVWITDFGLAKVIEQEDVTLTGDMVGTLRYLAPEQMDREADARSDVYALGLTLYELVTHRPAFDETSRHRLIKQVFQQEPPRPRTVSRDVPRDLETVILKAIARDPAHRYQTAGQMRDDLLLFLQDRPVTARRVTAIERLRRWCRRNPMLAGLTSTVFVLLITVAVVACVGAIRVSRALDGETRQRERAETTSELAFQVLDRIYTQFAPDRVTDNSQPALHDSDGQELDLPHQPVVSKETAVLLENLLQFYDRLAEQAGDDPQLLRRVADANRRVGDIQSRLGHHDEARDALSRSATLYQALENQSPDEAQFTVEIARVYNELGRVYGAMRQMHQGRAAHQKALELLESSAVETATEKHDFELARTHYFLGVGRGPPLRGPVAGPAPRRRGPSRGMTPWGTGPSERGTLQFSGGPRGPRPPAPFPSGPPFGWAGPQRHLHQAVDLLQGLLENSPSVPEYRRLLAQCFREMVATPFAPRNHRDSSVTLQRATEILEEVVEDFPDVADYRYDLCEIYARSGSWWSVPNADDLALTEERLQTAMKMSKRLVAEHPNVPDYATLRTQILSRYGELMRRSDRRDEAETSLREALAVQSSLAERFPEVSRFKLWQTRLQMSLAEVLRDKKELAEARSLLERSVTILKKLREHDSTAPFARWWTSAHYTALADVLGDMGEEKAAAEARSQAVELRGPRPFGPRFGRDKRPAPDSIRTEAARSSDVSQPIPNEPTP